MFGHYKVCKLWQAQPRKNTAILAKADTEIVKISDEKRDKPADTPKLQLLLETYAVLMYGSE
jgi:hypothetical protein